MLRWSKCGFHKKHAETRYAELVFWHPVGSAGYVVYSDASAVRNIDALFFMLGFDRYRLHKKHAVIRYAKLVFLHPVGSAGHVVHSVCPGCQNVDALFFLLGCLDAVSIKSTPGHVTSNICFCIRWNLRVT
jgi:hypothetical protein